MITFEISGLGGREGWSQLPEKSEGDFESWQMTFI